MFTDPCQETDDVLGTGTKIVESAHLFGQDDLATIMTNCVSNVGNYSMTLLYFLGAKQHKTFKNVFPG